MEHWFTQAPSYSLSLVVSHWNSIKNLGNIYSIISFQFTQINLKYVQYLFYIQDVSHGTERTVIFTQLSEPEYYFAKCRMDLKLVM